MYERLLDKQTVPLMEDLALYCGGAGEMFLRLNRWLAETWDTAQEIRFPYGNQYGWCVSHRKKKKLICDIFAENGAFTVMMRLPNQQFAGIYGQLSAYGREVVDNKYPCGEGGWIRYRVVEEEHLDEAVQLLTAKCE
ncbi:MAG: DUF3788 domain-containing protein [Oscillospiraceae bacterium]|nr:DUF3788 domain-containing protein [Oscillospiraceae bacterium]